MLMTASQRTLPLGCSRTTSSDLFSFKVSILFYPESMHVRNAQELFTGGQPRPGDIVSFEVEPRKETEHM